MTQNLRVALWVPMVDPAAIGNAVLTTGASNANKRIPSEFAEGGGGGGETVDFADDIEVSEGLVENEAISPKSLRTEMAREFAIPAVQFTGAVAVAVSAGAASANRLLKTDSAGKLDNSFLGAITAPPIIDGGTF